MKKVLWFDTETTGLDPIKNGLIQIAGYITIDGKVKESFNITAAPFETDIIEKEALDVTGKTEAEIRSYRNPVSSYKEFKNICLRHVDKYDKKDKLWLAGHNVNFDFQFLLEWAKKCNDKYLGSFISYKDHFCTLKVTQALKFVDMFPETENNKLETLCNALGVELNNAHDAMADITATVKLGSELVKVLRAGLTFKTPNDDNYDPYDYCEKCGNYVGPGMTICQSCDPPD